MIVPCATYRLQFRQGMTFERAATLAPYWRKLGISHLYASPVFAAVRGSTHGYDVTDPTALDPDLGGEVDFRALARALKREGLGLILDFVPNHMAASVENLWWRDVLRRGANSHYGRHFDIDWDFGPLTLPFLGEPFEMAAKACAFSLERNADGGMLRYQDVAYPLNEQGTALVDRAADKGESLDGLSRDSDFLNALHETQFWRLSDWRTGRCILSYRRFFEITGLVGLRVEDTAVFEDVHATLFALVDEGLVQGIRLDHIDGLADPVAYLLRLRERIGSDCFIVVEKILEPNESLPPEWPVAGTTGYEFIDGLARLLCTDQCANTLDTGYRAFTSDALPYEAQVHDAKLEILAHNLAAEVSALTALAQRACTRAWPDAVWIQEAVAAAVTAMAAGMPVYRTYVRETGPDATDSAIVAAAVERACKLTQAHPNEITALAALLKLAVPPQARANALAFALRFQQTTGAVMAKAVEDTAFYRFNRLIGLNEVGGDPGQTGIDTAGWHSLMTRRREAMPHGLNATATHDTKRGEDGRARLYAISEAPELWRSMVDRWARMIEAPPLDGHTKWLIFQSLLGVWPIASLRTSEDMPALATRFTAYAEKAVREAKRRTSWTAPDPDYEHRVHGFVEALFSDHNTAFQADFETSTTPFIRAGIINSLTQLLLKLTAPGIPDVYQGTETWDLSLVDPDNRRPPDFDGLGAALQSLPRCRQCDAPGHWAGPSLKLQILARTLAARAASPARFTEGIYKPLAVFGPARQHVVAFARVHKNESAITIAPRQVFGHVTESGPLALSPGWLSKTVVDTACNAALRHALTGEIVPRGPIDVGQLLGPLPVALLLTQ